MTLPYLWECICFHILVIINTIIHIRMNLKLKRETVSRLTTAEFLAFARLSVVSLVLTFPLISSISRHFF